jgi:hypothetical protein
MRQRSVTEVVHQRCGEREPFVVCGEPVVGRQIGLERTDAGEKALHHVRSPDRVREPRMFSARERQRRHTEHAHAAKPLDFTRIDQVGDDAFVRALEGNQPVHGVAKNHRRA